MSCWGILAAVHVERGGARGLRRRSRLLSCPWGAWASRSGWMVELLGRNRNITPPPRNTYTRNIYIESAGEARRRIRGPQQLAPADPIAYVYTHPELRARPHAMRAVPSGCITAACDVQHELVRNGQLWLGPDISWRAERLPSAIANTCSALHASV